MARVESSNADCSAFKAPGASGDGTNSDTENSNKIGQNGYENGQDGNENGQNGNAQTFSWECFASPRKLGGFATPDPLGPSQNSYGLGRSRRMGGGWGSFAPKTNTKRSFHTSLWEVVKTSSRNDASSTTLIF